MHKASSSINYRGKLLTLGRVGLPLPTNTWKIGPKIAVAGSNKSEFKTKMLHCTRTLMLETDAMSLF